MMNVIQKIDLTVEKFNMLKSGDTVVAGVSGGKDSMLMLYYLLQKLQELDLRIIVANVEHGIRGQASIDDSAFVERFCKENGIEFRMLKINAEKEAVLAGLGVEEYSRQKRYEFFSSIECDKIATAHSLSDNVETVIFRLARGTSLNGLGGIPAVRGKIIRPLIELTSDEIVSACGEYKIDYVTDESNFENVYSRNKIRNEVVPILKSINPNFENAVSRFINSAAEDESFLRSEAEKYVDSVINLDECRGLDVSVKKRVIELYAERFGVTLDEKHLTSVLELCDKTGKTQIKGSLFAYANKTQLYFANADETEPSFEVESKVVDVEVYKRKLSLYKKEFTFVCDCDKICGNVSVRARQEGDAVTLISRNVTKSLKKLFNELKIPVNERNKVPVICDDRGVIGVYGITLDKRVSISGDTKRCLLMNIKSEDIS